MTGRPGSKMKFSMHPFRFPLMATLTMWWLYLVVNFWKNTTNTHDQNNVTIVTAFIDINRDQWKHYNRTIEEYLLFAIPVLTLNIPIVVFVEEAFKSYVEYQRLGKEHITQIIVISLKDLDFYANYDKIRNIMESDYFKKDNEMLNHPEAFAPEYVILTNSKISLLFEASRINFFQTNYFFWLDFGYGHGKTPDIFPKSSNWAPKNLMKGLDKITFIVLQDLRNLTSIFDIYRRENASYVSAGFFGGSTTAVEKYHTLHKDTFLYLLEQGIVDDEQTVAVACYFKDRFLFRMVNGDWFDAFKLFH